MIKASIIGASGYTGVELLKIFSLHDQVNVMHLVSPNNVGKKVTDLYSGMHDYKDYTFSALDYDLIAADSDVVFCAFPHAASAEAAAEFIARGVKVIDLSADYRYDNIQTYEKVYKVTHPHPELKKVYGITELFREDIKVANLIANAGCYTTASIMPLYPLIQMGLIDNNNIIINASSGVTGAGRKATLAGSYTETNENYSAYAIGTHRHTSEIEEKLSVAAGSDIIIQFTPHLLPVNRGILTTICTTPLKGVTEKDIKSAYNKYYQSEQFVILGEDGDLPELKQVRGSNYIKIGYVMDTRTGRLIIISAIDNLIKGASGQAVQNMNVMFGIAENIGLKSQPMHI